MNQEKEITRYYELSAKKKKLMDEVKEIQTLESNIEFLAKTLEPLVVANLDKEKFAKIVELERNLEERIKNFIVQEKTIIETLGLNKIDFQMPNLDKLNTLAKYFLIIQEDKHLWTRTIAEKVSLM